MDKDKFIHIINGLYPADSGFPETEKTGKQLLDDAMHEAHFNWRDLPVDVLEIYAAKCEMLETMKNKNDRGFKIRF